MDLIYGFAAAWIAIGAAVYVWHNTYVWECVSESFKKEITSFHFFLSAVLIWPVIAAIVAYIEIDVAIKFRRWKKENGFN